MMARRIPLARKNLFQDRRRAVLAVGGVARRATGTRLSTLVASATGRIRAARQLLRPPDPAWVRLAVMRC